MGLLLHCFQDKHERGNFLFIPAYPPIFRKIWQNVFYFCVQWALLLLCGLPMRSHYRVLCQSKGPLISSIARPWASTIVPKIILGVHPAGLPICKVNIVRYLRFRFSADTRFYTTASIRQTTYADTGSRATGCSRLSCPVGIGMGSTSTTVRCIRLCSGKIKNIVTKMPKD